MISDQQLLDYFLNSVGNGLATEKTGPLSFTYEIMMTACEEVMGFVPDLKDRLTENKGPRILT
jgi:hypothetical protein